MEVESLEDIAIDVEEPTVLSTALDGVKKYETRFDKPWYKDADFYKMSIMLLMIVVYFFAELIVGIATNSLTLIADSFHMLSDGIGIVIGIIGLLVAKKKGDKKNTYGYIRAEPVGGLINSVFLLSVVLFIFLDAIQRFIEPTVITNPLLVLIVGIGGLIVNIIGLIMFCGHAHHGHDHGHDHSHTHKHAHQEEHHHHSKDNNHSKSEKSKSHKHAEKGHKHNEKHHHNHHDGEEHHHEEGHHHEDEHHHEGEHHVDAKSKKSNNSKRNENLFGVFLHVFGDFLGSIGVIITTAIIMICRAYIPVLDPYTVYVDPLVSLFIALIICCSTIPLFIRCSRLLLQSVPTHINIDEIIKELKKLDNVKNLHEFHVWSLLSSQKVIGTVHLITTADTLPSQQEVLDKAKTIFHQYGIHSFSIQLEVDIEECRKICSEGCIEEQCCSPFDNQ